MKTKLIAMFVSLILVLVLSACGGAATPTAAPADGGDGGAAPASGDVVAAFDFNNSGAVDICELYLSPVGTESWGPDQLKGQKIAAGGKFTLTNIPANSYDAKWVGCDKTEGTIQVDIKNP
jgi:hypothetical protein